MPETKNLLLAYRQETRYPYALRFYCDGLVEEYSDRYMAFEDGQVVTHSQPLEWRAIARLNAEELRRLEEILRQSGFAALPGQVGSPAHSHDAAHYTWTATIDGTQKTVEAYGAAADRQPALKALSEAIQAITADAFDRESNGQDD